MNKILKSRIFLVLLTATICISGAVFAAVQFQASEIAYKNTTVDKALDNLYDKADSLGNLTKSICTYVSEESYGEAGEIGARYDCEVGPNIHEYFYLLKDNDSKVTLLMEKNLSDTVGNARTMTWFNAIEFFEQGQPGYATKQSWTNVQSIDLPAVQDIVDVSLVINPKENFTFTASTASATWWCFGSHVQDQPNGPLYCPSNEGQQKAAWLFNYTRGCSSRGCSHEYSDTDGYPYGYWTKDIMKTNTSHAWTIDWSGDLGYYGISNSTRHGVRPVITLLKSNLSN